MKLYCYDLVPESGSSLIRLNLDCIITYELKVILIVMGVWAVVQF
jgi:hypothetical protein